jgi:phage gp29-like protein
MKRLITAALFAALPAAAFAENQLERLESISERMMTATLEAMVRMVEKQGGNPAPLRDAMPDVSWNDEYRDAGDCLLERFTAASSSSDVSEMLDEMEAFIPQMAEMDLETMSDDVNFLPEGMTENQSMEINSECGITDVMMERMEESGFTAAMMQSMSGN